MFGYVWNYGTIGYDTMECKSNTVIWGPENEGYPQVVSSDSWRINKTSSIPVGEDIMFTTLKLHQIETMPGPMKPSKVARILRSFNLQNPSPGRVYLPKTVKHREVLQKRQARCFHGASTPTHSYTIR